MHIKPLLFIAFLQTAFQTFCLDGDPYLARQIYQTAREAKAHHSELINVLGAMRGELNAVKDELEALRQTQVQMAAILEAQSKFIQSLLPFIHEQMNKPRS